MLPAKDSFTGLPAWDEVKLALLRKKENAAFLLREVNLRRIGTEKLTDYGSNGEAFRAQVLDLLADCYAKLDYRPKDDCARELKRLALDELFQDPHKFSFEEAVNVFLLLIAFLEVDGVTKFERKDIDLDHAAVGQMEEAD